MEDLILFLTIFILCFVVFLINYLIKLKQNKLNKLIGMDLLKVRKKDQKKIGLIIVLINSIIISTTGTLCTMIDMDKIWQLLYGFVLLTALIYVFYGILRNILESKERRGKRNETK